MSENRIKQAVAKVVFDRLLSNNKNYIWIRISRAYLTSLAKYWRNKYGFRYIKIYEFDRISREVGQQLAWINKNNMSSQIINKPKPWYIK